MTSWDYKFSPDSEMVSDLLDAEVMLMRQTGIPFCPCQGRTRDRKKDMKIVCPCIPFHKAHFDAMKRCWWGCSCTRTSRTRASSARSSRRDRGIEELKTKVAKVGDVLPGGLILVQAEGSDLVLCNYGDISTPLKGAAGT